MKEFMQKFDKNKDGRIEMSEVRTSKCFSYYVWKAVIFIQGVVHYPVGSKVRRLIPLSCKKAQPTISLA